MFKENKKYKVKFRRRNIKYIIYFYLIIFSLFILILLIDQIRLLSIPTTQIYSLLSLLAIIFSFYLFHTSKYSLSEVQRIKAKLQNVIRYNKLFIKDKTINPYYTLTYLYFIFYKNDETLFIESYAQGAPYALQSTDLGKKIESALNLNLTDIKNTSASHITFIFDLVKAERLTITKEEIKGERPSNIILDANKTWDFSKIPHALISGATGSGKTYMVFYLLLEFAQRGADIYLLDPKRSDLYSLQSSIPNGSNKVASTPNTIAKVLRETNEVMNFRYKKVLGQPENDVGLNYKDFGLRPIVIFFDEVAAAMEEDKKIGKEIDAYLKQLILKGRQAGVFIILSTQKPNAEAISTVIRDQVGLRIALGQLSKSGYRMALGDEWEELPSGETGVGKGFIFIEGKGWILPRPYESPFLDLKSFNYREELYSALVTKTD